MGTGVAAQVAGRNALCGERAGGERVVDAFAGEGLHHARGVADQQQIVVRRRDVAAGQRGDRAPQLIGG